MGHRTVIFLKCPLRRMLLRCFLSIRTRLYTIKCTLSIHIYTIYIYSLYTEVTENLRLGKPILANNEHRPLCIMFYKYNHSLRVLLTQCASPVCLVVFFIVSFFCDLGWYCSYHTIHTSIAMSKRHAQQRGPYSPGARPPPRRPTCESWSGGRPSRRTPFPT